MFNRYILYFNKVLRNFVAYCCCEHLGLGKMLKNTWESISVTHFLKLKVYANHSCILILFLFTVSTTYLRLAGVHR